MPKQSINVRVNNTFDDRTAATVVSEGNDHRRGSCLWLRIDMATLPTGNVITVTSTATLSGNKAVQVVMKFEDRHTSSTQSVTGTLSDLGKIKLELDVQEDSNNISDFVYNCAEFTFSMFSDFTTSSGSKLSFGAF